MDDAQLGARFGSIERQLKRISEQLGIDCPPFASDGLAPPASEGVGPGKSYAGPEAAAPLPTEVIELARAGHRTQAISLLRNLTGATLVEAKRAIDDI